MEKYRVWLKIDAVEIPITEEMSKEEAEKYLEEIRKSVFIRKVKEVV